MNKRECITSVNGAEACVEKKSMRDKTVTEFQSMVYGACKRIPRGRVSTYGELARAIGCGSARAVGQALKRNPFAPKVPCHRVISSDLKIGGFQGAKDGPSIDRKISRLKKEGVLFHSVGKLKDASKLFRIVQR